ncbi:MAG: CHAP domain-containing protein [Lachnospiraceae bacterium]|nr:CHAP domain-containing protein [Lachnospiraceae bacterium]
MERVIKKYLEKFNKEHKRNRRLGGIFLVLALLVTAGISWQLRFTGIALTNATYCGLEEHTHTDECYEEVLICELEESDGEEGHTHTDECYTETITLVCTLEESEGHVHTADCYQTVESYVCGLSEGAGAHTHDANCYDAEGNVICGLAESEGHVHTADCVQTEQVLICGLEEGEGAHTHTDACYETTRELTCDLEEGEAVEGHTHTEECYEKVLVCELEEHTHTAECLIDETADVETASDWEATLPTSLTGTWAENLVAVAKSQLGYAESTANYQLDDDGTTHKGYTRYGEWYGNKYGDWCAMFASFCLHYAGIPEKAVPAASGVYAWTVSLDKMELYRTEDTYTPSIGDLIFFDTDNDGKADHVGIVEKFTTYTDSSTGEEVIQTIFTIEGNSSNTVKENKYSPSDSTIVGYADLDAAHIAYTGESMYAEAEENEDESETENESESETESEVESESETDTESETETETETESETEIETETMAYELISQGEDYTVVVSFGEDVELPEDAVLVVEEYYEDSETYQARYAEAAALYGWGESEESGNEIAKENTIEEATETEDIENAVEAENDVNDASESGNKSDEKTVEESAVIV